MSMYKSFEKLANEAIDEINNRIEAEKREAQEKDLSQFDFKIRLSKITYWIIAAAMISGLFILFRSVVSYFTYSSTTNQESTLDTGMIITAGLLILPTFIALLLIKFKPLPEVKGSYLYYKYKEYHYSEVRCIKISEINTARVYLDDGKSFWLSRDFENYDMFIGWAEKCEIPVDRKERC